MKRRSLAPVAGRRGEERTRRGRQSQRHDSKTWAATTDVLWQLFVINAQRMVAAIQTITSNE